MYIHHDAHLIFLAHPRTASMATATALKSIGFEKLDPPSDHHSRLWAEGTPFNFDNRSKWTAFTAVRNHWDTVISWLFRRYSGRANPEPPSFNQDALESVLDKSNHWVWPHRLWALHADDADVILHYEVLEGELNALLAGHDLGPVSLPLENVSENRGWRAYQMFYSPDTRAFIAERFADEIEALRYHFIEL